MAEPENTASGNGSRRAAIALIALGPKTSAAIMKHLSEDEVDHLTNIIAQTGTVDSAQAEAVLNEAVAAVSGRKFYLAGGIDYAKEMLEEAFGRDLAGEQIDRLVKAAASEEAQFEQLAKVDPRQLAKLLQGEHMQAIAVIVSRLYPSQAAVVLANLPNEVRVDVLRRVAALDHISPEMMRLVSGVVRQKLHAFGEFSRQSSGGVKAVADICNRMEPSVCSEVFDTFEYEDPEVCDRVRRFMFVFEDLVKLDGTALGQLISELDKKLLMVALKGTSPELQKHVLSQMSVRAAEMLREDMAALGPVRIRDVDGAQQEIIAMARNLERQNRISLTRTGQDEAYVE